MERGSPQSSRPERRNCWISSTSSAIPQATKPSSIEQVERSVHRRSPLPRRHLELVAHRAPDELGVLTGLQRLVDGPAAERLEHMVVRDRLGVALTEVVAHPGPEVRQPHGDQGRSCSPVRRVGAMIEHLFG